MKKKKPKYKKKSKAAKAKPRDKHNRFVPPAGRTDDQILTKLLKERMRQVPKTIPLSLMVVRTMPNKKKLRWSTIVANNLINIAIAGKDPEALNAIKVLLDRIEGKVPETLRHGLDEYSPELVALIQGFLNAKKTEM